MDKIRITGGNPLNGKIAISGAKNSALPIMAASLLCPEQLEISNVPDLHDIISMCALLKQHGVSIDIKGESDETHGSQNRKLIINASKIDTFTAPYELVRKMRASILVLGPLLTRFGEANVSLPGGCAIGTRPVDMHITALEKMGAKIKIEDGYIHGFAKDGLNGAEINFDKVSVGATENIMAAATLANGKTIISNAALEPEIEDLAKFLNAMGAKISGAGSSTIIIEGVKKLHGAKHELISDRIEAGTFAIAAAITGGNLKLVNTNPSFLTVLIELLKKCGVRIETGVDFIRISNPSKKILPQKIKTAPYPLFPTDLQAQMMALLALSEGESQIEESIFENRFMHVPELVRMGAKITVEHNTAFIHGVETLNGAEVMATDLRASVSLVLAALAAKGETVINRVYHLDRGYEHIEKKLRACSASIERIAS